MDLGSSILAGQGIGTLGSLFSGFAGLSKSSKSARHTRDRLFKFLEMMYQQGREDVAPWRETGGEAARELWDIVKEGPGEYEESPYYNFLLGEGIKARERSAAAKGNLLSPASQKELERYGQQFASTDYDNWLNRWYQSLTPYQSISSQGLSAAGQSANMAGQFGQMGAQNWLNYGNVGQQNAMNLANLLSGAFKSGSENYLLYKLLGQGGGREASQQGYYS